MSQKDRTIKWIESKIISEISKRRMITTHLALSAIVLENVRSISEQHNLDIALQYLVSKGIVIKDKDADGFTIFKLAA